MSSTELASTLNEEQLEKKTTGVVGLILGVAIKYGLPSVCCAWLFYVIWTKDLIIYNMTREVTAALVESNHARGEQATAIRELADAVKGINR